MAYMGKGGPTQALAAETIMRGGDLAGCMLSMGEWIHRCVESVTFLDDETIVRRISVDITVPEYAPARGEDEGVRLIPLAFIRKVTLKAFDVRDAAGAAIPVLTSQQNAELMRGALHACAIADLVVDGGDASARSIIGCHIDALVSVDNEPAGELETSEHVGELASIQGKIDEDVIRAGPLSGLSTGIFLALARQFPFAFVLLAEVHADPGERIIVKFQYAEDYRDTDDERGWLERFRDTLGWTHNTYEFVLPSAETAESFHFELTTPEGITITEAVITGRDQRRTDRSRLVRYGRAGQGAVHMFLGKGPFEDCTVRLNIRGARPGWLRTCLTASAGVSVLMIATATRVDELRSEGTASGGSPSVDVAAMLLAIVATVCALVVRSGEHALTTRILFGVRVTALIGVLTPLVGAWLLAFGPTASGLRNCWWVLATISAVCSASIFRAWLGPKLLSR